MGAFWPPFFLEGYTLDIKVECNTDDETIFANVSLNSARTKKWLRVLPEHDGHAVICGSGPSLLDTLDLIRWRVSLGQHVFALNNAANILAKHGIASDYQLIIDARPETFGLLGPAKEHLFCSQVNPAFLDAKPDATIFHPAIDGLEDVLPQADGEFALVGGGTTSGITALCVAYAMGYRKIHLFGYDSCHRGDEGHAEHQSINDREPWGTCEWNGKTYRGSITMLRQAELFQPACDALLDLGCTITVDGSGLIPDIARTGGVEMTEREKYARMWEFDQYRHTSPGEQCVERFIEVAKPFEESRIIDFGCGTGRASVKLAGMGYRPVLVDFVATSRDAEAMDLPFIEADILNLPDSLYSNHGLCADVLEHLPTPDVQKAIESVMSHCKKCFFQVSMVPDNCGKLIGQTLHLTVKPFQWWLDLFFSLGLALTHAKNDGHTATFYAQR